MHKNPFVPQPPPYNPPQPPLPPGPPPPQATQPDYSAYWAAATAAAVGQPQAQQAYNPQWPSAPAPAPAPLPPRPPPEQSALYANYGYGGSQNFQWQQQQQQQQQHQQQQQQQHQQRAQQAMFQPPQPPPQPPAMQPYTPYQPQAVAGYVQPYVPQAPMPQQPAPVVQNQYVPQPQQPGRQYFPQQPPPPSAKRQKFDGPGSHNRGPQPLPPPPQFQPPPPPSAPLSGSMMQQQRPMSAGSFSSGRGGAPGGGPIGRGGGQSNRGGNRGHGRGGSMMNTRGGTGRGRGGNMYGGGRGGSQSGNQLKSHGSRGNFGGGRDYGNRDHGNRRGGSFVGGGGGHHQGVSGASFRGRGQGHAYPHFSRGGRHDTGSGSFGPRDGSMASSSFMGGSSGGGKKDENRRNFTDFKIVGLEIQDLSWTWGAESLTEVPSTLPSAESEDIGAQTTSQQITVESADPSNPSINSQDHSDAAVVKGEGAIHIRDASPSVIPPPPSRMRIYFHSPTGSRRGKRKKLEDDDGDLEEGRAPPPPPGGSRTERSMSVDRHERASAAPSVEPSVAESASEGDWLMAAIGEDEGDGEDDLGELQLPGNDPHGGDGGDYAAEVEYGSFEDGVATQVDDGDGVRDMAEGLPGLIDGQALDNSVHEAPSADSLATTQAVVVPETQDPASSLDTSGGGSDNAVVAQLTVAPHPEQLDASGPFEVPGPIDAQTELAASAPTSDEGVFVISPSSSAPAVPDSSVLASSSSSDTSVAAPPTELVALDEEQPTDNSHSPEIPAPPAPEESTTSSASIVERSLTLTQEDNSFGDPHGQGVEETNMIWQRKSNSMLPIKAEPQRGVRTPSANRLSISYAAGTKRLVINAEIVERFKILRSDGRVEISLRVEKDDSNELNGIIIESLSEATKSYSPLETPSTVVESDTTVPPFSKANVPPKTPLSEPKWVKSGDVQEWLKSMFGRMFWVTGDTADGWEKKIQVVDPDPAPTIWTVLDGWAANSPTDHILEILLRLVRGERATPFTQAAPAISAPSVAGPLLAALSPVLALWRMTEDYAAKALPEKGHAEAEQRLGEIIRCLPSHLVYKSLDGMFKEWKVEKKSGR
ncbi:hypothetical protein EI94DRAFT_1771950 [Lactarius quietus]|nr:hypothetical protein EI94DRAFT_1771950 [Lactarius quietus]